MSKKVVRSNEIRDGFSAYFESKAHKKVNSASLVPAEDPTLLFTNAGMNQFKSVFTGEETRSYSRAVSAQKCVRAGGKHNDLENVGYTARHHTFFEMLGNFSFGDYFKKEAISFAWEFTTQYLQFPLEKLYVTVYQDDEEAYQIWKNDIGLDPSRIYRFGEKDNFWSMGDVGPCGPCTELFYDQGDTVPGEKLGDDSDRFLEFWNLVFMEFEQKKDGSRIKLPNPSIDTGMGLERAAALAQGVTSNYETDLFLPMLNLLAQRSDGKNYHDIDVTMQASYRVIADHLRCMTFLIGDGILPSNEGRGYVLRRIMRRAMRHGKKINFEKPFLYDFSQYVVEQMADVYPELKKYHQQIQDTILAEEKRFSKTIDRGLGLLESEIAQLEKNKKSELGGDIAFHLYDTYGFPVDMTADILREKNLKLDEVGFEDAFEAHKEKARGTWKKDKQENLESIYEAWKTQAFTTGFLGYETLEASATVTALVHEGKNVNELKAGQTGLLLCDRTPFYAESGGQVGDQGSLTSASGLFGNVGDTQKALNHLHVHHVNIEEGEIHLGDTVQLSVDKALRYSTAKNHTATHLLHAALIKILGEHVRQKGSLVSPDRLRFDFSHGQALTASELKKIEKRVNEQIWQGKSVSKQSMSMDQAQALGAMALFGEKYGEDVRVVSIGDFSIELCGGTHLDASHEIGLFKITKESSVSAGIRRIEALTSDKAMRYLNQQDEQLQDLAKKLNVSKENVVEKVESLLKKNKEKKSSAQEATVDFSQAAHTVIEDIKVLYQVFDDLDGKQLRDTSDRYLEKIQSGVVILATKSEDKASLLCKVSKDLLKRVHAGNLIKKGAQILGGSGGGRPDMAQAGGPNIQSIDQAIKSMLKAIEA